MAKYTIFLLAAFVASSFASTGTTGMDTTASVATQCPQTKAVDLVFLVDGTGSVGEANFNLCKDFLKNVAAAFDIGSGAAETRFGLVKYSESVNLPTEGNQLTLPVGVTEIGVETGIEGMTFPSGGTNTGAGIAQAETLFSDARPGAVQLMIVLTDGQSGDDVAPPSIAARANGITIFSIGVGSNIGTPELEEIASKPSYVFEMADFNAMMLTVDSFTKSICDIINDELTGAPTVSPKVPTSAPTVNPSGSPSTSPTEACASGQFIAIEDCLDDAMCQGICTSTPEFCPEKACACETLIPNPQACCGGSCHDDYDALYLALFHTGFTFNFNGEEVQWDRTVENCKEICLNRLECDAFTVVENVRCEIVQGFKHMEPASDCETCWIKLSALMKTQPDGGDSGWNSGKLTSTTTTTEAACASDIPDGIQVINQQADWATKQSYSDVTYAYMPSLSQPDFPMFEHLKGTLACCGATGSWAVFNRFTGEDACDVTGDFIDEHYKWDIGSCCVHDLNEFFWNMPQFRRRLGEKPSVNRKH